MIKWERPGSMGTKIAKGLTYPGSLMGVGGSRVGGHGIYDHLIIDHDHSRASGKSSISGGHKAVHLYRASAIHILGGYAYPGAAIDQVHINRTVRLVGEAGGEQTIVHRIGGSDAVVIGGGCSASINTVFYQVRAPECRGAVAYVNVTIGRTFITRIIKNRVMHHVSAGQGGVNRVIGFNQVSKVPITVIAGCCSCIGISIAYDQIHVAASDGDHRGSAVFLFAGIKQYSSQEAAYPNDSGGTLH